MANDVTEMLAQFAATLTYDAIPERVREHCRKLLLDALACALAGHQGEETEQVAALASGLAQSRESSIIGGDRLSLAGATLLNGYLITAVTMCDVYRPTHTHITPEVVPPALAIAERHGRSGRDLLVALAVGAETMTRIGRGLDYPAFRTRGFHGPGVIGPFGAAAAVGRLLGLDPKAMAAAFGLAGSQAAGTFAAWGTPTVKFHQCRGALSGLMAALLAQQDFAATRQFLTAPDGGLFNSYSNGGCPDAVIECLGEHWELEQIDLRLWPSASLIQGLITAMFDLVEGYGLTPQRVQRLRLSLSQAAFQMHGNFPRYEGKFQAMLSAHYSASAILHDRELSLTQFEPVRYNDPELLCFAATQVAVESDPALTDAQAMVAAETAEGRLVTVRCDTPRGGAGNPLTMDQVEGKFRTYAKTRLPDSRTDELIGLVLGIEEVESVQGLMDALRAERP
jgi:2-methylcitrate dehydratase PrpD